MRKSANRTGARAKAGAQAQGAADNAHRGMRESTLATLQSVGQRSRAAAGNLKGRLPSGQTVRARVTGMREWSGQMASEHPVGMGLGALALGFLSAALFPASRAERRAFDLLAAQTRELADRLEVPRRYDEVREAVRQGVARVVADQLTARVLDVGGGSTARAAHAQ
jgi:hypothetical protein